MSNAQSLLSNVYLFKDLSKAELDLVGKVPTVQTYEAGEDIFREGDEAEAIFIIRYGTIKIERSGMQNSTEVATLGTGSHFGEMAFVDGEKRSATAVAIEHTEVVRIGFNDLKETLNSNPKIAATVYKSLAHFLCGRLRVTTTDLSFSREKNLRHF